MQAVPTADRQPRIALDLASISQQPGFRLRNRTRLVTHRLRQLSHAREICVTLRLAFFSCGESEVAARLLSGVDDDMTSWDGCVS